MAWVISHVPQYMCTYFATGRVINGYQLTTEIARGGDGAVWLALHLASTDTVYASGTNIDCRI